jgi:hypothetical protein
LEFFGLQKSLHRSSRFDRPYLGTHWTSFVKLARFLVEPSNCEHCTSLKSGTSVPQDWVLQEAYCKLRPVQYDPPFLGTGESQKRVVCFTPPPHVRLHSLHGCQGPHPPVTGVSSFLSSGMHSPWWHQRPLPHEVPSAHGSKLERQP